MLFAHCFPPEALFIHSPRGNGARAAGTGVGVLPGALGSPESQPLRPACPRLLGRSRPFRGARSLRGPVGFVWVSLGCALPNESPRLQTHPDIPHPAPWLPFPPASPWPWQGRAAPAGPAGWARPPRSHLSSSRRKSRAAAAALQPAEPRARPSPLM